METIVRDAIERHLEGNGLIKTVSMVSEVPQDTGPLIWFGGLGTCSRCLMLGGAPSVRVPLGPWAPAVGSTNLASFFSSNTFPNISCPPMTLGPHRLLMTNWTGLVCAFDSSCKNGGG